MCKGSEILFHWGEICKEKFSFCGVHALNLMIRRYVTQVRDRNIYLVIFFWMGNWFRANMYANLKFCTCSFLVVGGGYLLFVRNEPRISHSKRDRLEFHFFLV